MSKLMLSILGGVAEFERSISERYLNHRAVDYSIVEAD
jgi:hypothetical protein